LLSQSGLWLGSQRLRRLRPGPPRLRQGLRELRQGLRGLRSGRDLGSTEGQIRYNRQLRRLTK